MNNLNLNSVDLHYALVEYLKKKDIRDEAFDLLAEVEKSQYQKFFFEKDKNLYLLARYLLRTKLSTYCPGIAPKQWIFKLNSYGKPYIANDIGELNLFFNLAHSKEMVVCAFSINKEIGVDVENTERTSKILELAERSFSKAEFENLKALKPELRQAQFFRFWTLKESYVKARGMGLQIPLDQFSFHIEKDLQVKISFDPRMKENETNWQMKLFTPIESYQVAVSVQSATQIQMNEIFLT